MLLLATASLTFDGFEYNNYETLFAMAHTAGYRRVEFNCWYSQSLLPERMRFLKNKCEQSGLEPIALHVSAFGGNTPQDRAFNTAHKLRAMEAARELGCRRVVASSMQSGGSLDDIIYELECLEQAAREYDVILSLENHCDHILAGVEDYRYIFQRIDSPMIGACLDGGHLEAQGERIDHFIELLSDRINHVHLKENKIFGKKSFCRFGQNGTDNRAMLELLMEKDYSGYMSVELSPEIGESGESTAFTLNDWRKPVEMFIDQERE